MYRVEIESLFRDLHHFNWFISCGGYNSLGSEIYVTGAEGMWLECDEASSLRVLVYAVANTLPSEREIAASPPFAIDVHIIREGERLFSQEYRVNQWGGAAITIDFKPSDSKLQ